MRSISPAIMFVGAAILMHPPAGEAIRSAGGLLAVVAFIAWLVLFVSDDLYPKLLPKKNDESWRNKGD